MKQAISADTAIYDQIEPPEDELPSPERLDQCVMLRQLLAVLDAAECLSARGRILKAWTDITGGAPVRSNSREVEWIMQAVGHAQTYHVSVHLKAISNDPALGRHFRYVLSRKAPHTCEHVI